MTSYALCLCLIHYLQSLSILPIHNPADYPLRVRERRSKDLQPTPEAVAMINEIAENLLSSEASNADSDSQLDLDPDEPAETEAEPESSEESSSDEELADTTVGIDGVPRADPLVEPENDQNETFEVTDVNSLSQLLQGFFWYYKRKATYEHVIAVTTLDKEKIPIKVGLIRMGNLFFFFTHV